MPDDEYEYPDPSIDDEIEELLAMANKKDNAKLEDAFEKKLVNADEDFKAMYQDIKTLNDTVDEARKNDKNIVSALLEPAGEILEEEGVVLACQWPEERRH